MPRPRCAAPTLAEIFAGFTLLLALLLALLAAPLPAMAAQALTLEQIMADPDWIGTPPESPYWADDGSAVYFERKRTGAEEHDLYRVPLKGGQPGGEPVLVPLAERGKVDAPGGDLSRDRKHKAYSRAGDLYLKDLETGAVRQVTRTADDESDPHFMVGDRRVQFHRGATIFVYDLDSGLISQPADLRQEKDPAEEDAESAADYLKAQQLRLFDVIRERQEKREAARAEERAERQADPTLAPLPWYLGDKVVVAATFLSPDGDWMLAVTLPKDLDTGKKALMADFVTASGNVESKEVRTKVGAGKPVSPTLLLLDLRAHEKHEINLATLPGIKDDPLKELRKKAAEAKEKAEKEQKKDQDQDKDRDKDKDKDKKDAEQTARPVELTTAAWSKDGRRLALQLRAYDNKDRWIATVEPSAAPVLASRHRLTDPAWINWTFNEMGWLEDNATLWYLSEDSGFSHLYLAPAKDGSPRQLTRGRFEVSNPALSRDGRFLYYTANADHPGRYDAWRVDVASGHSEQLSRLGGLTTFILSPDESRLLLTNSQTARPDELFVQESRPGAEAQQITHTVSAAFQAQPWTMPEIVPVPSSHGKDPIYSRVYTPPGPAAAGNAATRNQQRPAVVFVHGAGYLQNAHAGWSSYFHEFMFHTYLTQHGYVVLDMDYRASAGYGRDWRTAIYRRMGTPELEDLKDGVAWLVKNRHVDPRRVGVYGGSYGGFMTYMALFRAPDLFAAGAALRPVSDWAHYNHEYTSNILNTPEIDPEAYAASSPIEYVAGLRKPLLICDGMQDDNVFFQDNVRLVQRLIELKKENFELAVYPVEAHGFKRPSSWLDEYRRIFKLMETYVKNGAQPMRVP
jgi:dipeptidyl aminopeptidase/acylaminoacyl peptidase